MAIEVDEAELFHGLWSRDPALKTVFRRVERVADEEIPVLVRGETGSGKELVARALHTLSSRRSGPFQALNCAALPANLLESELFGHARGAFTGAVRDTPGHIQRAHGGTLFLDEIAEIPLELQAKLLRVLETRSVIPVGARDPVSVDIRVVSATHRSLRREVEAGRFRADLMYRLRVVPIFIPPLRARVGDVRLLTEKLIQELNLTRRRRISGVSPAAWEVLERHPWPGNVRELRNTLLYVYALGSGEVIDAVDLPPDLLDPAYMFDDQFPASPTLRVPMAPEPLSESERIVAMLTTHRGDREASARALGMSRTSLWRKMRHWGIQVDGLGRPRTGD